MPREYPVDAVAQLAPRIGGSLPSPTESLDAGPLRLDLPYVVGPIEVLGTGKPSTVPDTGPRTLAAYRVQLSDDLAPRLVLMNVDTCVEIGPVMRPNGGAFQDLGLLRRVGDETHFFVPVGEGSRRIYVDTETTTAFASRTGRSPQLVIAVSPNDSRVLACGELRWR